MNIRSSRLTLIVLSTACLAPAALAQVPNTFQNGQVASAPAVNANFTAVDDKARAAQTAADAAQVAASAAQAAANAAQLTADGAQSTATSTQSGLSLLTNLISIIGSTVGIGTTSPGAKLGVVASSSSTPTIRAVNNASSGTAAAIEGRSSSTTGGSASSGATGVLGVMVPTAGGSFSAGVRGVNQTTAFQGAGVIGHTNGTGAGVIGNSSAGRGLEGATSTGLGLISFGNAQILGNIAKSGGSFRIDHPLDPANKTLSHSFVESPDMMNIYNGNVVLGADGRAVVQLPEWFAALNRDYRYQLTPIGGPGQLWIDQEVVDNHFTVAGPAGLKVSWQVTGIRQDRWANAHRIPVEEVKPASERGYYLNPDVFGFDFSRQSPQPSTVDRAQIGN